jgi:polyphosphate glucokinase
MLARMTKLSQTRAPKASTQTKRARGKQGVRTLAIDIGGTGLKAIVLDEEGTPLTERARVLTPRPATTKAVLSALLSLMEPLGNFERISVGFPGVVIDGVIRTAPNLHPSWRGFDLATRLSRETKRPTRVLNDAGVQGFGVIDGRGLEMLLTLGTGMGCALFIDGKYVPNLELAHHPFRHGKTYEEYVGAAALEKVGKKAWNRRVARVVAQVEPVWNPRQIYLGGGNAKHLKTKLPPHVKITANVAGLMGGIALWRTPESPDKTETPHRPS